MMPTQISSPTYILGGVANTEAGRDAFWAKMMAALSVTQLIVGISCVAFHVAAFYVDQSTNQPLHYIGEGLLTGGVIIVAGVFGLASSKRRSNCSLITFLVLSILAGLFALFPMVFGIMGATMVLGESDSLMMPISQLVLATVEMIVATWSIGVSSQVICCPNSAMAQNATRLLGGVDLPQFLSSQEGQPVVIFSSGPQPQPLMYAAPQHRLPYLVHNGSPAMQFMPTTGMMATTELANDPAFMMGVGKSAKVPPQPMSTDQAGSYPVTSQPGLEPSGKEAEAHVEEEDEDTADAEKKELLKEVVVAKDAKPRDETDGVPRETFETEDEEARLLGE